MTNFNIMVKFSLKIDNLQHWLPVGYKKMDPKDIKEMLCPKQRDPNDGLTSVKLLVALHQVKTMMFHVVNLRDPACPIVLQVSLQAFASMVMRPFSGNRYRTSENHLFYTALTKIMDLGFASLDSEGELFLFSPKIKSWFIAHGKDGIHLSPLLWDKSPSLEEEEAEEERKQHMLYEEQCRTKLEEEKKKHDEKVKQEEDMHMMYDHIDDADPLQVFSGNTGAEEMVGQFVTLTKDEEDVGMPVDVIKVTEDEHDDIEDEEIVGSVVGSIGTINLPSDDMNSLHSMDFKW